MLGRDLTIRIDQNFTDRLIENQAPEIERVPLNIAVEDLLILGPIYRQRDVRAYLNRIA
jgi:hypothetical protein